MYTSDPLASLFRALRYTYQGALHKDGGKECYVSDGSCMDDSGKVRTRD